MPGYIGYTPQFQPISLQEYLTVPMMILESRKQEAEKADAYRDKISYYKDLLGPEAASVFAPYDNLLNKTESDIYNNNTQDLASEARQLRKILRDISTRADLAKENRDRYRDMMDKDPSLIGELGSMYEWFKNPNRKIDFVSTKDIAAQIGGLTKNVASGIEPKKIGSDKNTGIDYYETGIDPITQESSIQNALSGNITTGYEQGIRNYLDNIGYDSMSDAMKRKIENSIRQTVSDNSGYGKSQFDTVAKRAKEAQISHTYMQNKLLKQQYADNEPEIWNDLGVDTSKNGGRHYEYKKKKFSNGYSEVYRTPIDSNGNVNGKPEPAPNYYRQDGTFEEATYPNNGMFGITPKESTSTSKEKSKIPVIFKLSSDGKLEPTDLDPNSFENSRNDFKDVDLNNSKHSSKKNALRNEVVRSMKRTDDEMEFRVTKDGDVVVRTYVNSDATTNNNTEVDWTLK